MRPINKKAVIISAELTKCTDKTNKHNTDILETLIVKHGLSYKHLVGSYKGIREASFLVEYDTQLPLILDWAEKLEQESVLLLDEDRNAQLFDFKDQQGVIIGKLQAITSKQAIKLENFSYCPLNNQFFGVL